MDEIKDIITALLKHLGVSFKNVTVDSIAGQTLFRIESDEPQPIIGPRGETLRALDLIVKKVAEQQGITDPYFIVDVNDYKKEHIQDLQNKARMMAERARSFEYDVELSPMSAYERLIVHTTLSDMPDIKTESQGEGRDRRVVIKYSRQLV